MRPEQQGEGVETKELLFVLLMFVTVAGTKGHIQVDRFQQQTLFAVMNLLRHQTHSSLGRVCLQFHHFGRLLVSDG